MQSEAIVEKLFHPVICNDETEARQVVQDALAAGVKRESLNRDAFLPLLRTINALHRGGQLTGLAHHYALQLLQALTRETGRRPAPRLDPVRPLQGPALHPAPPHLPAAPMKPAAAGLHAGSRADSRADSHIANATTIDDPLHAPDAPDTTAAPAPSGHCGPVDQYVSIWISAGVLLARPVGPRISEREAPIIATEITDAMDYLGGRLRRFVLDLTDVQTMSSMALGLCIDVQQRARAAGAKAVMYGVGPHLAEGLRAMKVDRLYAQARDANELRKLIAA